MMLAPSRLLTWVWPSCPPRRRRRNLARRLQGEGVALEGGPGGRAGKAPLAGTIASELFVHPSKHTHLQLHPTILTLGWSGSRIEFSRKRFTTQIRRRSLMARCKMQEIILTLVITSDAPSLSDPELLSIFCCPLAGVLPCQEGAHQWPTQAKQGSQTSLLCLAREPR